MGERVKPLGCLYKRVCSRRGITGYTYRDHRQISLRWGEKVNEDIGVKCWHSCCTLNKRAGRAGPGEITEDTQSTFSDPLSLPGESKVKGDRFIHTTCLSKALHTLSHTHTHTHKHRYKHTHIHLQLFGFPQDRRVNRTLSEHNYI